MVYMLASIEHMCRGVCSREQGTYNAEKMGSGLGRSVEWGAENYLKMIFRPHSLHFVFVAMKDEDMDFVAPQEHFTDCHSPLVLFRTMGSAAAAVATAVFLSEGVSPAI